jgi:hypothetical protein
LNWSDKIKHNISLDINKRAPHHAMLGKVKN